MNSLEFIEKCIKETKRSIEHWKEQLKRYPEEEVLTRCLNTREIELQAFQEVRIQLEAWEVVKEELQITSKSKNPYGESLRRYELNVIGQNKIDTLNKALEVTENE